MEYDYSKSILNLDRFKIETLDIDELYYALPKYDKDHALRVSLYGTVLFKYAVENKSYPEDENLTEENVKYIKDALRYHDIGKALKQIDPNCNLTEEELEERHPTISNSIFSYLLNDFEELSKDKQKSFELGQMIAVSHHENWNGTGYPEKKKGIEINIFARVCRIVNDYDNLTAMEKLSHGDAMKKIVRNKGTKYDSILVDDFKAIDKTIAQINYYLKEEGLAKERPDKVYNDENISNILLGRNGRIRNGMSYNKELFKNPDKRPIELLFTKCVDLEKQNLMFVETHVVIDSDIEGTLFPSNYEYIASHSDRYEKLNKWALTEIGTIHESWELRFQRDVKFLVRLSANTLVDHVKVTELVNYLGLINVDSYKVAFEVNVEELQDNNEDQIKAINEAMAFLRQTGNFEFVLDGMNPNYPSYDLMMAYEFDYLKVDYRLYRGYTNLDRVSTLIGSLSDLCRNLGTKVIFSNIKTKDEAKLVNQCGIEIMSGSYFGELVRTPNEAFFRVDILD